MSEIQEMTKQDRYSDIGEEITESPFPQSDVKACMRNRLNSEEFVGHIPCPKCGQSSEKLLWIEFNSPAWTWKHLCGRQGPLSICPHCKIQVEFICTVMN